jgi:hypothetical protein
MMYGTGLPILFPIAFVSFFSLYMLEVYMLFYVYRKPLDIDMELH